MEESEVVRQLKRVNARLGTLITLFRIAYKIPFKPRENNYKGGYKNTYVKNVINHPKDGSSTYYPKEGETTTI